MKFGKIKFFAHQASIFDYSDRIRGVEANGKPFNMAFKAYRPIPLFRRAIDRAITAHEDRIHAAKTNRRNRQAPSSKDWS